MRRARRALFWPGGERCHGNSQISQPSLETSQINVELAVKKRRTKKARRETCFTGVPRMYIREAAGNGGDRRDGSLLKLAAEMMAVGEN